MCEGEYDGFASYKSKEGVTREFAKSEGELEVCYVVTLRCAYQWHTCTLAFHWEFERSFIGGGLVGRN